MLVHVLLCKPYLFRADSNLWLRVRSCFICSKTPPPHPSGTSEPLKLTADFKTAKGIFSLWDKTVQSSTFVVVFILCAPGIKDDQTFKKQPRGLKSSCITVIGTSLKSLHYESLQFLGSKLSLPHMFGDFTCCCISLTFCRIWLPHCCRTCALLHALVHCCTFSCTVTRSRS